MGAVNAFGTLFKMSDMGGTPVFTTVGGVRSISLGGLVQDFVETTNHSSPSRYKEKMVTLKDAGQVSFTINLDPNDATHKVATGLLKLFQNGTANDFQLVIPSTPPATMAFSAFLTNFPMDFPIDDVATADIELEISGPITLF